jgi:hypothetical protein
MQMRYLWRLAGEKEPHHDERWAQGIVVHLRYQPLTTVLVWREQELHRYLVLDGCPCCQTAPCHKITRDGARAWLSKRAPAQPATALGLQGASPLVGVQGAKPPWAGHGAQRPQTGNLSAWNRSIRLNLR